MNRPEIADEIEREVAIAAGGRTIRGTRSLPQGAAGVVVFAHGSGSGRYSPRNQYVAEILQQGGLATLLLDLLEEDEANDRSKVFDIALLADRLQAANSTSFPSKHHSSTPGSRAAAATTRDRAFDLPAPGSPPNNRWWPARWRTTRWSSSS